MSGHIAGWAGLGRRTAGWCVGALPHAANPPLQAHLELPQVLHRRRARLVQVAHLGLCDLVLSAHLVAHLRRRHAEGVQGLNWMRDSQVLGSHLPACCLPAPTCTAA